MTYSRNEHTITETYIASVSYVLYVHTQQ